MRTTDLRLRWGLGVLLVILVFAVFGQARSFEFLRIDDQTYVSKNPDVATGLTAQSVPWAFTALRSANWHPLTWLSHMLDVELFGLRPGGHHLMNVAIHAATTVLVFAFLLGLAANPWAAAALAAIWAIHPLRAESVAWIAERKDVLSGFFWMACVLAWLRRKSSLALALFAAGLLAKPMLVTLPIVLLLLDRWPLGRTDARKQLVEKIPFFALAAGSAVVTYVAQQRGGAVAHIAQVPVGLRIENALVAIPEYLFRIVWPVRLAAFYPFDLKPAVWQVAGSAALIAVLTLAVLRLRRTKLYLAVGWGWFVISLLPVIGLVQIGFQATADRYSYLPSIGLLIMAAGAIPPGRLTAWILGAAVLPLALLAHRQTAYWHDGVTLFTHSLEMTGSNYVAERYLADALRDAGREEEATALRIRQLATRALPGERDREALALLDKNQPGPARQLLEIEIRENPANVEALCHLGIALGMQGSIDDAAARFEEAIRVKPAYAPAHYNLGLARERQGRDDDAIAAYTRSLDLDAANPDGLFNLARVLARRGRFGEAEARLTALLRIQPDYPGAAAFLSQLRAR